MGESFAGITVPDGDPDALEAAAGQLSATAGALQGVGGQLRAAPGLLAGWLGPAALTYGALTVVHAAVADAAVESVDASAGSLRRFASELRSAQQDARAAIKQAHDADRRIKLAKKAIAAAQADAADAAVRGAEAAALVAASALGGVPDPKALAAQATATTDAEDAHAREVRARRDLERAQEDLRKAQARGRLAEQRAQDADQACAGLCSALALPWAPAAGAPASAALGEGGAREKGGGLESLWSDLPWAVLAVDTSGRAARGVEARASVIRTQAQAARASASAWARALRAGGNSEAGRQLPIEARAARVWDGAATRAENLADGPWAKALRAADGVKGIPVLGLGLAGVSAAADHYGKHESWGQAGAKAGGGLAGGLLGAGAASFGAEALGASTLAGPAGILVVGGGLLVGYGLAKGGEALANVVYEHWGDIEHGISAAGHWAGRELNEAYHHPGDTAEHVMHAVIPASNLPPVHDVEHALTHPASTASYVYHHPVDATKRALHDAEPWHWHL